ncbi:MAG: RraA family protein [Chloroflexi bacterium]|nr:RraA family protein [Chloroflexota bacterium]MDA1297896.1 RraA family protein [Chloroflexota bacterium]
MALQTVDPSILKTLGGYDSATVQNAAIFVQGYTPAERDYTNPDLRRMLGAPESVLVGYALTSTWMPLSEPTRAVADRNAFWDSIGEAGAPVIAVLKDVDSPARRGAIIGDGMAFTMRALGAIGAVVDGNARDLPGIEKSGMQLWATGQVPGHGPFHLIEHGIPVQVAGLEITPGDILVCDGDGVTRVPPAIAAEVARACADVRVKESKLHRYFTSPDFDFEKWRSER